MHFELTTHTLHLGTRDKNDAASGPPRQEGLTTRISSKGTSSDNQQLEEAGRTAI